MGIAGASEEVELLEELLAAPPSVQPARRIRAARGRLQAALLTSEIAAGLVGGGLLAILAGLSPVGSAVSVLAFLAVWRTLGSASAICADDDLRPWTSTVRKAKTAIVMALAISWLAYGALMLAHAHYPAGAALLASVAAAAVSITLRGTANVLVYRSAELAQRTVIVGSGMVARQVYDRLRVAPYQSLDLIGLVDDDVYLKTSPALPHLGGLNDLERIVHTHDIDRVIIAFTRSGHDDLLRCIRVCWDNQVAIDIVPRLFEFLDGARALDQIGGLPMLSITVPNLSRASRALKRGTDIVLSGLGLLILSPLLIGVAIAIKLDSRGPVLFRQQRVGRNGKEFSIFKFRSMFADAEARKAEFAKLNEANDGVMFKIHKDPRITRVGGVLRRSSIDELPQLLNVLWGKMSLVGPRPLIPQEIAAFEESWHRRRLDLRPGITGPWQIYGRSDIPFQDMLRFDYQYVAGWSLARDLEIILATVPVALSGRGAY
ncbi:MAG TPA: sugar transferase [Solirubrobacteraceae bacterium]|nr:sugar transferase [Solirubrobacteraceae bacterium]